MKILKFAVLPGDGIGPEVMEVTLDVLKSTGEKFGFELDYDHADIGGIAIDTVSYTHLTLPTIVRV